MNVDLNGPKRIHRVAWTFSLILLLAAAPSSAGVLSTSAVVSRTGQNMEAWGAAWWQWAFAHPEVLGDTTGEFGQLGDVGGPVFFAEGSGGGMVDVGFTVPGNQFILLPVATYVWTLFDPCDAVACAADIVNSFVDGIAHPFASIDGVAVPDLASHVVRVDNGAPFVFKVDAGPIGPDGYGGILDAVQGGIWLMLEPLPVGTHSLKFGATVPVIDPVTGEVLEGSIDLDTTLQLTAVPEPPSALLLGLGLLALAFGRRSRQSRVDAASMS